MNCGKKDLLLYAVTDRSWLQGETLRQQVEKALQGGATFLQLREKEMGFQDFCREAEELKILCAEYRVPFVINDGGCRWRSCGAKRHGSRDCAGQAGTG